MDGLCERVSGDDTAGTSVGDISGDETVREDAGRLRSDGADDPAGGRRGVRAAAAGVTTALACLLVWFALSLRTTSVV